MPLSVLNVCFTVTLHLLSDTLILNGKLSVLTVMRTSLRTNGQFLTVDGAIALSFVDLLKTSGAFTAEEADEYLQVSVIASSH